MFCFDLSDTAGQAQSTHPLPLPTNRPENATAAYALARLRRPRVSTEAGLTDYEELLRVRIVLW